MQQSGPAISLHKDASFSQILFFCAQSSLSAEAVVSAPSYLSHAIKGKTRGNTFCTCVYALSRVDPVWLWKWLHG